MTTETISSSTQSWEDVMADELARSRSRRLPRPSGLTIAVAFAVLGFALIGYTWWKVSDLTNIAQQLPYFVSGGLTGLGLVVLAAATLVVVTRRGDEQVRQEQAQALVDVLRALSDSKEDDR